MMTFNLYKKALNYGLRLLLYHGRSKLKLENKLLSKGYSEEICKQVIVQLCEWGYLDDKKFAENYIYSIKETGIGRRKIYYSLLKKGISQEIATEITSLNINEEDEMKQLAKVAEKKILNLLKNFTLDENSNLVKGKLFRYLLAKGFTPNHIKSWIDANFQAILDNIINKL